MKRGRGDFGAPPELSALLSCIDFLDNERRDLVIARDLVETNRPGMAVSDFLVVDEFVARLLADGPIKDSDLKGLIRRLDLSVSLEYWGSPRDFFADLRSELATWISRLGAKARR